MSDTGYEFTTVVVKATGIKQDIPTVWLDDPHMMEPFALLPSDKATPSDKWTKEQLLAHATSHGVDLGEATSKADILAAINTAAAV